mmetsp:Transcript_77840/g.147900  ORF Transcript_77840/g.147900 Transcript_77840/m.147900 type:complete len:272 (-) Transcript_77840:113-928(-)
MGQCFAWYGGSSGDASSVRRPRVPEVVGHSGRSGGCGAIRTISGKFQSTGGTKYATQTEFQKAQRIKKLDKRLPEKIKKEPRPLPTPKPIEQDAQSLVPIAQAKVQAMVAAGAVGNLMLEQVPKDNSCLFSGVLKAVGDDREAAYLRQFAIPDYVDQIPPEDFQAEAGGRSRKEYKEWIKLAESWGGFLELYILSRFYYGVQICVVDVQNEEPQKILFPERPPTSKKRIYLLYNGVHYDPIVSESGGVFSASDMQTEVNVFACASTFAKAQ